jgi:hypothetical protein
MMRKLLGGMSLSESNEFRTLLGSLPAPYAGLKAAQAANGDIHFLMYCKAYENGTAYNEELVEEPLSSALIYTSIYVRYAHPIQF